MRDRGEPAPRTEGRKAARAVGRLPLRRVRLVTALFPDLDAAMEAARTLEERGYASDRVTVLLSPAHRNGPDLEVCRRSGPGTGRPALREPGAIGRGDRRSERLDDLLEDARLLVAAEAVTEAEGREVDELLSASGGWVVAGTNGPRRAPSSTSPAAAPAPPPGALPEGS